VPSDAERQTLTNQHRAVSKLLDTTWDPIGVYEVEDDPIPGEYEAYAWEVLRHLRDGDSAADIAGLLRGIKSRQLEMGPGPEDERAARALVAWFHATHL
jgi:hypothetical protein